METVFHKLFVPKSGKKSKQFGLFCRKSRQAPAIIELPAKEAKPRHQDDAAIVVAMPPPDVRLVLFQECGETSDRKLIFDSKSFDPIKPDEESMILSMNNLQHGSVNNNSKNPQPANCRYQYVRGPQDMCILSEMLFGTVGMASRASSLKIHVMKEPQRIMLSRVFCVEYAKETVSLDRGIEYQRAPPVLSRRKAKTLPVPTPEPSYIPPPTPTPSLASSLTSRITRSDSSSSLMSLTSIFGASLGGTGSLGSRSMPQQIPSNRAHSLPPASRQASRDSFTLTQEPHHGIITSRRTKVKIGFAVIFQPEPSNSSDFHRFFFEHFPLIESYLTYLKDQIESALNNFKRTRNQEFIEFMMEILHIFTSRINSIYSTPRLPKPVWSSLTTMMISQPWKGDDITVKCFVADLARMVTQHNTKNKNYFMSGLITSVLTHHLGWVNTMIPSAGENDLQTLAYNPLWAQLGDLYGAVGTPTKVAKTLILGEIHELVSTIISILSYFIRSSDIAEVVEVPSDMSPQVFLEDDQGLTMSLVPSELESNEYVFVTMDSDSAKTEHESAEKTFEKPVPPKSEKPKFSFCRKNKTKNSEPIAVIKPATDKTLAPSSGGASLCRSKSSPGTSVKPPIPRVNRQKSSGNMELTPTIRTRTNSNDTFARPRGVQSRRTSHDVPTSTRMSKSSSALVIPDLEQLTNDVASSLEGSKSLCLGPTPTSALLRKRLGNENIGSCPNNVEGKNSAASTTSGQQNIISETITPLRVETSKRGQKTHKRVSSEPFRVATLQTITDVDPVATCSSLVKTQSTYSPIVRQTFVDTVEPKVVNATHVQRSSQPIMAMNSPRSSPHIPRSKSSVGQKGPIMGFRTSEEIVDSTKIRSKHKSGSFLQEFPIIDSPDFRDVFSPKNQQNCDKTNIPMAPGVTTGSKFNFNDSKVQRSSSSVSVNSVVRRSSSAASNKVKLAGRRRKLTDSSSKQSSIDGSEEKITGLPPLDLIPNVSLEHDNFNEYFEEDDEKSEFINFSAHNSSNDLKAQSTVVGNQSTVTKLIDQNKQTQSSVTKNAPPPLPTRGPCQATLERIKSNVGENQPGVTKSLNQKAENQSSMTKRTPPPLPTTGPNHRSKSETVPRVASSPNPAPKFAPPLPSAPPVHRRPLYPKLDGISTPKPPLSDQPLPKSSIYPNLHEKPKIPTRKTGLYPKLDEELPPPSYEEASNSSLYPKLPETPPCDNTSTYPKYEDVAPATPTPQDGSMEYFSSLDEVVLRPVRQIEKSTTKSEVDEKSQRLTFGELMADYSPDYLWGFALHGTRNQPGLSKNIIGELQHSVARPVLDEPVAEAVSIVADTDKWTVKVLSSHRIHSDKTALPALNSKLVTNILERITKLYQVNTPAEFCMKQLESSLGELVLKSRMLAGYVVGNTRVNISQLSAILGIESSDLPLLMAIASCHSPQVAAKLL